MCLLCVCVSDFSFAEPITVNTSTSSSTTTSNTVPYTVLLETSAIDVEMLEHKVRNSNSQLLLQLLLGAKAVSLPHLTAFALAIANCHFHFHFPQFVLRFVCSPNHLMILVVAAVIVVVFDVILDTSAPVVAVAVVAAVGEIGEDVLIHFCSSIVTVIAIAIIASAT